ncbi:MAG: menaquinone biosynthesis protein [Nitrospinota bacterium]|nr:menaquinone biosynthesis protein [Nitrospinota bacterium]
MSLPFLRFGFHDFLNAQPLLVPLTRIASQIGLEIILDPPAVIAAKLKAGQVDLGMIPSVEYLKQADRYRLFPGLAIASRGRVGTVILVTKNPLNETQTLALDNRSMTSIALLQVLFKNKLPPQIKFHHSDPDLNTMLKTSDAALIIGDQALKAGEQFPECTLYDLSEEWFKRTGKTFVHAVIAIRPCIGIGQEILDQVMHLDYEKAIPEIVQSWAGKSGISRAECEDYLRRKITYRLGEAEMEGLEAFRNQCLDLGLIDQKHPIRFVEN